MIKFMGNKFRYLSVLAMLSLLTCFSEQSKAFVITSVKAPNLQRPSDGIPYSFNITVSGLYDRLDEVASAIKNSHDARAQYWDEDVFFDDPIDLNGVLTIPLIGAIRGNPWGPVVGLADPSQFDPDSPYYDPKATTDAPRWQTVRVEFCQIWREIMPLDTLKQHFRPEELAVVGRGNRLSVMPVAIPIAQRLLGMVK